MAGGLLALLDDVVALARLAAASLDDVAAASARAGTKTLGVVIDDAAVTPGYVSALPPARELPIIGRIALGSLRNKLLIILPVALLLSWAAPWALAPILMVGGLFLCFEGAEKVWGALSGQVAHGGEAPVAASAAALEEAQVGGAIRTDLILSAEIMVITLDALAGEPFATRAVALAVVGVGVTLGVYGLVALLVKVDDLGLLLVRRGGGTAGLGRALVRGMPWVLAGLARVGTAAMLWVGGGILLHGLAGWGVRAPEEWVHHLGERLGGGIGALRWLVGAVCAAALGLAAGALVVAALHLRPGRHARSA